MESAPEEFFDVYEKVGRVLKNVRSRDAGADLDDPSRSTDRLFAPTVGFSMTMLKDLENKNLSVAIKDRVRTLQMELRFLRTASMCIMKLLFWSGIPQRFIDIWGRIESQFVCANRALELYVPKETFDEVEAVDFDEIEAVAFDAAVCNVLEDIKIMRSEIMEAYYWISSQPIPSEYPMIAKLVVEFIYLVIDTLGVLLINYYDAANSKCKQILTVGERLKFVAEFIWFTINQGIDGVKLREILISAEAMAVNAAGISYFLWTDSDARHIYAATLKVFQPVDSSIFDEFEVIFLFFLGDYLILRLKNEALTKVPVRNEIVTLLEEVRFLKDNLTLFTEQEEVIHVFGLARRIGSVIGSPLFYENMAAEISPGQQELLEILKPFRAEVHEIFGKVITRQKSKFPKVAPMGFINSFLEELKELISTKPDMIIDLKDQILAIHGELAFCRSILQDVADHSAADAKLDDVANSIAVAAYEAEHIISLMLVKDYPAWHKSLWISDFTEQIKLIKAAVGEIGKDVSSSKIINIADKDHSLAPSQLLAPSDVVVGFKGEMELIKELLARGPEQLQIVAIVGMPGLGKTTLAKRAFEDPLIVEHFDVRGWFFVSPCYSKNEMLLSLLSSVIKLTDEIRRMKDEDLSQMLYQQLFGRRYLIVMDDVWGIDALEALQRFLPDGGMGSRIMLTSRNKLIGSEAKYHCDAIELRLLTEDESWDLLKAKVFHQETCPLELEQVGKQIAQKCSGLRLAVVVVAGLLARSDKKQGFWEQVSENLSSHILGDGEGQGMEVLELSYKLLPDHLKPCFLYLGAFPVDKVIPVRKLTWLWTAEGFVPRTTRKSLEDEAENNLMDLIDRSLVIIAGRRSDGRVKTCRVHDLLRDLCLAKAKEENFLQQIHVGRMLPDPLIYECRRVSIHRKEGNNIRMPCIPIMRSLLLFSSFDNMGEHFHNMKLLRVLDLVIDEAQQRLFDDLMMMVNLRYLSFCLSLSAIPSSVVNLWNLETLIVEGFHEVLVTDGIWKMAKLRHLHIRSSGEFILDENAPEDASKLLNLETFSTPSISFGEEKKLMQRIPNVRKLRCIFQKSLGTTDMVPKLVFPDELESLNARCQRVAGYRCEFDLPLSLKKLTLSWFHLQWNVISSFQKLPNLEILKLVEVKLESDCWDMGDDDFPKLKFLKLEGLNIKEWNASPDNFPCLEQLVLQRCKQLVKIPSSLGDICSLKSIAVEWSSDDAAVSAKLIQEEQEDTGNNLLKVHIYPPYKEEEDAQ